MKMSESPKKKKVQQASIGRVLWRQTRYFFLLSFLFGFSAALFSMGIRLDPPPKQPAPEPPPLESLGGAALDVRERVFDPEWPCVSRVNMLRARRALFREYKHPPRGDWLPAINQAIYEVRADCHDVDFLLLVVTAIQQESGVRVDPPLENTNLEALLNFKLQRLAEKNPLAAGLLDAAGIQRDLQSKLSKDTRRRDVKTEGDLVRYVEGDLRPWFRKYLTDQFNVPEQVAEIASEIGLYNPVSTIGPMQVNLYKAFKNARERGEWRIENSESMQALLLEKNSALERGILEGVYLLWKTYRFYRKRLPAIDAVRYTSADYNGGEFSSRNAAFQQRLAELSREDLSLDGDLLLYRGGRPLTIASRTERVLRKVLPQLSEQQVREDLLLEKTGSFSNTVTAKTLCKTYRRKKKKQCQVARLPGGAGNEAARIKHGRSYTPANYARAFLQRYHLNYVALQ